MIHLITTTVRVVPEIRFGVKSFFLRNPQIPSKEQSLFIVNIYRLNHRKLIGKISCYVTNSKRFAASTKSFSDSFMWIFTMILWSFDNQKVCILTQKVFFIILYPEENFVFGARKILMQPFYLRYVAKLIQLARRVWMNLKDKFTNKQ